MTQNSSTSIQSNCSQILLTIFITTLAEFRSKAAGYVIVMQAFPLSCRDKGPPENRALG